MKSRTLYLKLMFAFLCLTCAMSAFGQEYEVVSFDIAPNDLSARTNPRPDRNGRLCALIKVYCPDRITALRGNYIGDPIDYGMEKWIYVTDGSKEIEILFEKHYPLHFKFDDMNYVTVGQSMTYIMKLAEKSVTTPPSAPAQSSTTSTSQTIQANTAQRSDAGSNFLVLNIEPKNLQGLSVKVDGLPQSVENSQTSTLLSYGSHTYTVEAVGYETAQGRAVVKADGVTTVNVSLTPYIPVVGTLSVNYKPLGSSITLDGQNVGKTPTILRNIPIGTHTITISNDGYEPATHIVTVRESQPNSLDGSLALIPQDQQNTIEEANDAQLTEAVMAALKKRYDSVGRFSEGLAAIGLNGKYGFVDVTGQVIIPLKYEGSWPFSHGLAAVQFNDKWGLVDKNGHEVISHKYDWIGSFSGNLAGFCLNKKWGFVDITGREVINAKYDDTWGFSEGLAPVKLNGKWGFIDTTGREVIPLKYKDIISGFKNGKARVRLNRKWGFVDKAGNFTPDK